MLPSIPLTQACELYFCAGSGILDMGSRTLGGEDYRRALKGIITAGTYNILFFSSTFKGCAPFFSERIPAIVLLLLLYLEDISV